MSSHLRGLLQVAAASICYGFIGLFTRAAFSSGMDVGELLAIRYFISTLLLALVFFIFSRGSFRLTRRQWILCFLLGAVNCTLSSWTYFTAIHGLSMALAALLLYTFPIWALLINFILGERLSRGQLFGIAMALIGLVLLLYGEIAISSWTAAAIGVSAGLSYAIYMVIIGRFLRNTPSNGSAFWIIAGTTFSLSLIYHPAPSRILSLSSDEWLSIGAIVVVGTVIPILLVQSGLQKLSSTEASVFSLLEPVTAVVLSVLVLGEGLGARQVFGGALVLVSLILLSRRWGPARV